MVVMIGEGEEAKVGVVKGEMWRGRDDGEGEGWSKRWSCDGELCFDRDEGEVELKGKRGSCEGVDVSSVPGGMSPFTTPYFAPFLSLIIPSPS